MKQAALFDPCYSRSQAEWTLWQVMLQRRQQPLSRKFSPRFANRIKRFLTIDAQHLRPTSGFAFMTNAGDGKGSTRDFSLHDIFMLGLAIEFSDAGYPQQEIVYLLQHAKADFKPFLKKAMLYPSWVRAGYAPEDVPTAPIIGKNGEYADLRMFAVIQKNDIQEIFESKNKKTIAPIITKPALFIGFAALSGFLEEDTAYREPHHFIVEFGQLALELRDTIKRSPIFKRGRKAKGEGK